MKTVPSKKTASNQIFSLNCNVVENIPINQRYKYIRLSADKDIAPITKPGQFYMLKCPDTKEFHPFLMRPMSVYGVGPESNTIEFLYNVFGVGTKALSTLMPGNQIEIFGPLGSTFTLLPSFKRVLVVVRGVGLATMAPLIQEAHRSGIELSIVMSARTPDDLMKEQFLRGIENADVHCVFDSDNSSSMPSMDKLIRQLLSSKHHDMVYTCGSKRVLTLLQQVLKVFPDTQGEVALEQKMACGMGGCLSCVRPIMTDEKREYLRVCREGPVFPIANVVLEAF